MTRRICDVALCCSSAAASADFSLLASIEGLDFAGFVGLAAFARDRDLPRSPGLAGFAVFFFAFLRAIGPAPYRVLMDLQD